MFGKTGHAEQPLFFPFFKRTKASAKRARSVRPAQEAQARYINYRELWFCFANYKLTNLSHTKEPRTDSPWKRQILLGQVSLLSLPLVMGIAKYFLWEIFQKVFGSGKSDVRSGNSMTKCCVVNANILNTLIQLDNSKHHSRAINRLSEGRNIYILHAILTTRFPWVHIRVHQAKRSYRVSWAHVRFPEKKL